MPTILTWRLGALGDTVWQKIMLGLTMRSYKEVVQQFADAYGLEKSTTSEHFIQASREKLKQLLERYAQRRAAPVLAMQTVTDGLVRLFGMSSPWAQMLRNRGMSAVDAVRPLKRLLAQPALR